MTTIDPAERTRLRNNLDTNLAQLVTARDKYRTQAERTLDAAWELHTRADMLDDRIDTYLDRRNALEDDQP